MATQKTTKPTATKKPVKVGLYSGKLRGKSQPGTSSLSKFYKVTLQALGETRPAFVAEPMN